MLTGHFTTPYDYTVTWNDTGAERTILCYTYRDIKTCIDVSDILYYTIYNPMLKFPEYKIQLISGHHDELFFNSTTWWGTSTNIENFSVTKQSPEAYKLVTKLIQDMTSDMSSTDIAIFPLKRQGEVCSCKSGLNRVPNPRCKICYGTGIVGGYDSPIQAVGLVIAKNIIDGYTIRNPGRNLVEMTQIQTPYVFKLRKGDVMYDINTTIAYKVVSSNVDMFGGKYPILMTTAVIELNGEDSVYDLINSYKFKTRLRSNYIFI
jgi:hypothetical protein